jgi:hypothetical protein
VKHVRVEGDLAYVAAHWDGLVIFDVSRPDSPQRLGSFPTPGLPSRVAVGDEYVFVANTLSGPSPSGWWTRAILRHPS